MHKYGYNLLNMNKLAYVEINAILDTYNERQKAKKKAHNRASIKAKRKK